MIYEAAALAAQLQAGAAALFPTDTVVALGAVPHAAEQLWALKQRPSHSGPSAVFSPILGILLLGLVGPSPPAAALLQRPFRSGPPAAALERCDVARLLALARRFVVCSV